MPIASNNCCIDLRLRFALEACRCWRGARILYLLLRICEHAKSVLTHRIKKERMPFGGPSQLLAPLDFCSG